MSDKLISIIMPAYNAAALIEETLESVKNQSYTHWELIVVEDFSDDGTKAILDEFKASVGQNVVYHRNEVNKGPSATRNNAASKAKGGWYAFLDSDDIWHQDHLLTLMATALENPKHGFIYSTHIEFSDKIEKGCLEVSIMDKSKYPPYISKNLPTALFNGFMIQPSTVMVSAKLFNTVDGFDESYRYVEDLNFYFKILVKNHKFIHTGKSTSYYRQNLNGLTRHSIPMSSSLGRFREDVLGWNWNAIDKKLILNKTSEAWLLTARLSRKSDTKLAKYAIKKAVQFNFNLKTLFFLVLINSKLG
jgi:glycosyltransferase involved in cell wall biosynthesis